MGLGHGPGTMGLSPKLPFVLSVWALDPSPQFFLSRHPKEDGISAAGDKHLWLWVWALPTAGAHASPSHLNLALVWAGKIKPACWKLQTSSPSGAFMSPPRQNLLKFEPCAKRRQKPICPTRHTKGWRTELFYYANEARQKPTRKLGWSFTSKRNHKNLALRNQHQTNNKKTVAAKTHTESQKERLKSDPIQ